MNSRVEAAKNTCASVMPFIKARGNTYLIRYSKLLPASKSNKCRLLFNACVHYKGHEDITRSIVIVDHDITDKMYDGCRNSWRTDKNATVPRVNMRFV